MDHLLVCVDGCTRITTGEVIDAMLRRTRLVGDELFEESNLHEPVADVATTRKVGKQASKTSKVAGVCGDVVVVFSDVLVAVEIHGRTRR